MDTPERKAEKKQKGLVRRMVERARALAATNAGLKREIAERKRVQEETEKQKEILQRVFDNAPVMLNFIGADGQIQLINRELEQTLGWTLGELRERGGDLIAECYPDPREYQEVQAFLAGGEAKWQEFKTRVRDGRVIDTTWVAIHLSDGTRVGLGRDITAQKHAEETLRRSESQLAESQRLAHVGSWDWDIRNNVVTRSDEIYRIFGLDPENLQPTHQAFLERLHPEDRDFVTGVLENSLKTGEPVGYHARIIRSDGEVRTLYCQGRVVADEQGNPVRMFGMVQDVTAQQAAEAALKSSNALLRALSSRLESAREEEGARISRELHDVLGSALTTLKWDLEACGSLFEEGPAQIQALRGRIDGMKRLTDATINAVRRIASELRPRVLDELGLMAAIEWQARHFQDRTGIACHCHRHLDQVPLSRDQSTALFRVFQEALTNVLRHANATRVDVSTAEDANGFVFAIRDNGRGITEEERTSTWSLGLLGMRERVQAVGGAIDIAAAAGQGTTITVRFTVHTRGETQP